MNKAGKEMLGKKKLEDRPENSPETENVLMALLEGKEFYETIKTRAGDFKIIYPRPCVLREIELLLAKRFGDVDLNKIPALTVKNFWVYAMLDRVVVEAPEWWDKMSTSEQCPDEALIIDLYRGYLQFFNKMQQRIQLCNGEYRGSAEVGPVGDKKEVVGSGAFQGIAHG